jgi:hypothetical protein
MPSLHRLLPRTALATALAIAGCSGSTASIEESWRAPNARMGELTNVVTLLMSGDQTLARTAEDRLAVHLRQHGVRAMPAYAALSPSDLADRERAITALRNAGYDGVVTMRLVDSETKLEYVPTLDSYWATPWSQAVPETIVRIEVNAYSLNGNRLVWSGISKSIDPEDLSQLVNDVTEVVSRELDKERIIPGKPVKTPT